MKKGITNLVMILLLVLIVLGTSSYFFYSAASSTESLKKSVEEKQKVITTKKGANFIIINVSFDRADLNKPPNVTIKNNGKADLNLDELSIYLNESMHRLERYPGTPQFLRPGETATLKIKK